MLTNINHWFLSAMIFNGTRSEIHFNTDIESDSQLLTNVKPVWASLSLVIIILFTVCGNSLVCIAVIRERHLRNTTNYFLTSLAFTDCLVACLVMPLAVTVELIGHFPFNALACNVWLTFDVCCSTSSIWHMSVMSLDRYLTLRYPLKYGRNKRRSLMAYKIITIWLISFAICLPLFILGLVDSSNVYDATTRACFPSHRTFKIYGSFVAFFIPLIIMVVTYALTMSALQQAHSTKKKRHTRRQKMHAVLNLATMAMRWKRTLVNETNDERKNSIQSVSLKVKQKVRPIRSSSSPVHYERKRSSSLLVSEQYSAHNKRLSRRIFISNHRLNETLKPLTPSAWCKRGREKTLQTLPEKSVEQSSPSSNRHLEPGPSLDINVHTKRSHSCTPLVDAEDGGRNQRRSSSVHTLLQIRRDSAKISEELANLTAQLSAAMNNTNPSGHRLSLSVPRSPILSNQQTTRFEHVQVEAFVNQSNITSNPYLTVHSNAAIPNINQDQEKQFRARSQSTDIRLSSFEMNDDKTVMNNGLPIPDLLVTHESLHNSPTNANNNNTKDFDSPNVNHDIEIMPRRLTSPSKIDSTCQRIKDWINLTTFSTAFDHDANEKPRCISSVNVTESTPMLPQQKKYLPNSPLSNIQRYLPRIEQLYGQTSIPNPASRQQQQQLLLVDDHVASVHDFAAMQRSSVCSITSSSLTARFIHTHRASLSSSLGSTSQQGPRTRPPRLHDGMSQASFQMVSLDTEDSSSGSSSLTHQSINAQAAMIMTSASTSPSSSRKHTTIRNLTKASASNERKAMRVLLIIFSIFVILWTPFFVINLLSCFITNIHPILISVSTWLGYCSSGANPIIYTIFSRAFRRAFLNIITCRKTISSHRSQMFSPSCHSMTMSVARKMSTASKGHNDVH